MVFACSASYQKRWVDEILRRLQETKRCNPERQLPLPRIDDTLDLKSGYSQVGIHPEDKEKIDFFAGGGLYEFTVMPFGLCNTPATFERLMELQGLTWKTCLIYLDPILVMGKTFEKANLKLNPKKCLLFK